MLLCSEPDVPRFEMSEVLTEHDRSVLILIEHCNEMKRQERRSRILTCSLFLFFCTLFFSYVYMHNSQDCKHDKSDLEHSASALSQRQIESRPSAHLTALNCSTRDTEYLQWESSKGDAELHLFNYRDNALIAPQDGNYSIYLQITYRMYVDFPCPTDKPIQLKQEVFQRSDRYPEDGPLMVALHSVDCSKKMWKKSVYMSRVVSLEKGDQLKVKAEDIRLIDCSEKKVFFGAFLI